jgi:hypothetical protein
VLVGADLIAEIACRQKTAVGIERPPVVSTHQVADSAFSGPSDRPSTMGADIEECGQLVVGVTPDQDGPASDRSSDVLSRLLELVRHGRK